MPQGWMLDASHLIAIESPSRC